MENLRRMATFASVIEEGSFSAAARALGVTKAAVSKQIGRLESDLGVRLLQRTTRRLTLTEIGATFHEHCVQLVAIAEEAERTAVQHQERPTGTLRISAPVGPGQALVAPAVRSFVRQYDDVRVELHLDDSVVDITGERFDIAIRAAKLPDSSLIARKIAQLSMVVCASPRYLKGHGTPTRPADLTDHTWLGYTLLGDPQRITFRHAKGREVVRLKGRMNTNDGAVLRAWLLDGLGITMLPNFWVSELVARGRLRPILPAYSIEAGAIYAVHAHGAHPPAKVRVFIDHLVDTAR